MKWDDVKRFTWQELLAFRWAELTDHEVDLLQKYWNKELQLSPEIAHKLQVLCEPFAKEYNKRYKRKFSFKDFLSAASSASTLIRNVQSMGEEYREPFLNLLHAVLDFLHEVFS